MKRVCFYAFLGFLVFSVLQVPQTLFADITGTISGTVTDSSGAPVPGAAVVLTNAETGFKSQTTTATDGHYEFLAVPIGANFGVEVTKAGFRTASRSGITLYVNQNFHSDFQLELGQVVEHVTVKADIVQVETTSAQVGDVIESNEMTALPLNGRSYIDLLGLQPGVVPIDTDALSDRPAPGGLAGGLFSVNGMNEGSNSYLVNGGDVQEPRDGGTTTIPVLDSIAEFRILTSGFEAEFGRYAGGIVNVVTKSGTNSFHGSAFEFLRNDVLDSRNFFDTSRGSFKRNQFGGTVGGPIIKNRIFFFGAYQGTREVVGVSTGLISVPSSSMLEGNFSDYATTGYPPLAGVVQGDSNPADGTMPTVLSQRLGYTVNPGEPYWAPGCNSLSQAQAGVCVFPGMVIPKAAWSPAAAGTIQFIPPPTQILGGVPYFSTSAYNSRTNDDKFSARIDQNAHRWGQWSYYYADDNSKLLNPYGASANVPGFPTSTPIRSKQINVAQTLALGPTAINEARLNVTRYLINAGQPPTGLPTEGPVSKFGFVSGGDFGIIPTNAAMSGVPAISFTIISATLGTAPFSVAGQYNTTYHGQDNFSKVIGRHTFKVGVDGRFLQQNERSLDENNGVFTFLGNETGNDFADYLIGAPNTYSQSNYMLLDMRNKYAGLYGQDRYKLKPNVTISYGLRWEVAQPYYDTQGKIQSFVVGEQSTRYPDAPTDWVFPGDPGITKTISPTEYKNFAPRLGLAYSPSFSDGALGKIFGGPGKTSIRASFGIYYTMFAELGNSWQSGDAPFGNFYYSGPKVYLEEPFKNRTSGENPGQRFPYVLNLNNHSINFAQFQPISSSPVWNTDNVTPYANEYNFTIQRQVGTASVLSVGYVGSQAHHLLAFDSFNVGIPSRCLAIAAAFAAAGLPGQGCGRGGEDVVYTLPSGQVYAGTRIYSVTSGRYVSQGLTDFGWDTSYLSAIGNSMYNAFQASYQVRSGPLSMLASYTWSKSMDDGSYVGDFMNPLNFRLGKSLSPFNMPQNFALSYNYEIPSQRLTHSRQGALYNLLDGWSISGITRFAAGVPVSLGQSGDWSLTGSPAVDYPNYDGAPIQFFNPRQSANHQYFSTPPFSPVDVLGTLGTANVRFFEGPGLNNFDISLRKSTRVKERAEVLLRLEFFNVFNHAQFMNPVGDGASPSFGTVGSARAPRIGQASLRISF
jgi:hypothetical protein